jgi:hypothetical protein
MLATKLLLGRRAFTIPSAESSLQAWYQRDTTHFSDTARTTPVTNAGDLVRSITDSSPYSRHMTVSSSGDRGILNTTRLSGIKCLIGDHLKSRLATTYVLPPDNFTWACAYVPSSASFSTPGNILNTRANGPQVISYGRTQNKLLLFNGASGEIAQQVPHEVNTVVLSSNPSGIRFYLNGHKLLAAAQLFTGTNNPRVDFEYCNLSSLSFPGCHVYVESLLLNRPIVDREAVGIREYLLRPGLPSVTTNGQFPTTLPLLGFDGDSKTNNFPNNGYWRTVMDGITSTPCMFRDAMSAATSVDRASNYSDVFGPVFINSRTTNVLCIWLGTNDIFFGANAVQTRDNVIAYCNAAKALCSNLKIVFIDITDRTPQFDATKESYRVAFNSEMVGTYFTVATADSVVWLADAANTWADVLVQASQIPGLSRPDTVHEDQPSHVLIGQKVLLAVQELGVT